MYKDINGIFTERQSENYKIEKKVFRSDFFTMGNPEFNGQIDGDKITVLTDTSRDEIIMSNSVMEKRTNTDFVTRANGDVLIAGLGLGLIILAIQDKPEVKSITIVEISEELKDFILEELEEHLNYKVKIVISDINTFEPSQKYDVIYFDIWNNTSGGNWDNMRYLDDSFHLQINRKNKNSFMDSWRKKETMEFYYE